jgi:phenylalanyl-tRNA synthetase alpha chain
MDGLDTLKAKYLAAISGASDEAALEDVRVSALGKKGEISLKMRDLGQMEPAQRQAAGAQLNALKDEIDAGLRARKAALGDAALNARLQAEWLDVTLPGRPRRMGAVHPVSQVMAELTAIFADMGFSVAEGPQVESDWYNFDALNIPLGRSTIPSSWRAPKATIARRMCCAPIPRRCRSGR